MTDISKAAVDVAANVLRVTGEHYIASLLTTLRAALDEAEARAVKAEAERDAANALLRELLADCRADYPPSHGAIAYAITAHLGAKP